MPAYSALSSGALNVQSYAGAKGNGVDDDSGALRAAANYVLDGGGGVLFLPRGLYRVDTTAGPIIDVPANKRLTIVGEGAGTYNNGTAGNNALLGNSIIKRVVGTNPVLRARGVGDVNTRDRAFVGAHDVMLHGGYELGATGDVCFLSQCNDVSFHNVRLFGAASGSALNAQQLFNSEFVNCYFSQSGNGTTNPAVSLGPLTSGTYTPASNVGGQTVRFVACQWEGNTGTDLKVSGDRANTAYSYGIHVIGPKMERQVANATWPVLDLDYVTKMQIVGFDISAGGTNNSSKLVQIPSDGPNTAGQGFINFVGGAFGYSGGSTNATYAIDLLSGYSSFTGVDFSSIPGATYFFHIGANVNDRGWKVANSFMLNHPNPILDDRAAGFFNVASASSIKLNLTGPHDGVGTALITGSTTIDTIVAAGWRGRQAVLAFQDPVTVKDGTGNLKLNGDFSATADDTLTLVCTGSTWHEVARSAN